MGVNGHWYVEIEKQAWWRGAQHTWVNRYVMSGAQPSAADAVTVINALWGIERAVYPFATSGGGVGFTIGKAYPSGKGTFYASVDYNESKDPGTATGFPGPSTNYSDLRPGFMLEACVVVETKLNAMSSTGKPTFLRKYLRGFSVSSSEETGANPISGADLAFIDAATLPWQTGVGTSNWVVIGNGGAQAASAPQALPYLGNRQVPKGRKKKKASTSGLLSTLSTVLQDAGAASRLAALLAEA